MVREVGRDRLLAARQVVSMLLEPPFRESVPDSAAGKRPILVASMDDRMEELLHRIRSIGLPVALCVRGGSASMTVATVRATEAHERFSSEPASGYSSPPVLEQIAGLPQVALATRSTGRRGWCRRAVA